MSINVDPGITWTTATTGAGALGSLGVLGLFLRYVGPWRKQTTDAETTLREELHATNKRLEARLEKLERHLARTERRHDAHIEILSQLHSAEMAAMRHRLVNEAQVNVGLLAAIRAGNPEKLERVVETIETDRARREENIGRELAELVQLRGAAMEKIERLRDEALAELAPAERAAA